MPLPALRRQRLAQSDLDGLVAVLPHHVLMLSGYRPRLGTGLALATRAGDLAVVLPSEEIELARAAGVEDPIAYETLTLTTNTPLHEALLTAVAQAGRRLGLGLIRRLGYEEQPTMTPNAYVSTLHIGPALTLLLQAAFPRAELCPASSLLRELQGYKTEREIALLRTACALGETGFAAAQAAMSPGRTESEVASAVLAALHSTDGWWPRELGAMPAERGGGAWVMSGPDSALAYRAFAATGTRRLQRGDLVLVHMNPQVSGIWADLTRTFVLGEPDARTRSIQAAVFAARTAARPAARAGTLGREVDAAARRVLDQRGYGTAFKHGLGHGIGFDGISGVDLPMLHPVSTDTLAVGMCFNIEPAIYVDEFGGCRHCDALALTGAGLEELSPFLSRPEELVVPC